MAELKLVISEMEGKDLPFLIELWHNREVMRYADEFPKLRGWSKSDDPETAWKRYQEKRAELGPGYTQLILRLSDGTPIGESFFTPLPEGFALGKWQKPDKTKCCMGDIKLLPPYWGQGLGTEGMRQVVQFAFTETSCELFAVPPHGRNPAAIRVYEKAGFVHFGGMRSWRGHQVMELWKERFQDLYPV